MSPCHRPTSEAQAADIIRNAAASTTSLSLVGGNTRSGFGNRVDAQATLSSAGLSGILDDDPAEMVMTARAGTSMAEVEATLARNSQMLAFEPVDHRGMMGTTGEPTIGGVFLANASGPRRLSAGAARDSLLGLRFINGRGEAIRAGGRVMKNVTGLDLVKLLAGSHGTLGFVTEVTFRVLPRPEAEATLVLKALDDATATLAMAEAMAQAADVSGAAHIPASSRSLIADGSPHPTPRSAMTLLRLEGLAASVAVRATTLADRLSTFGAVEVQNGAASADLWRAVRDVVPLHSTSGEAPQPLWRVSVAPTAGYRLVSRLRQNMDVEALYDWQGGLVWLSMDGEPNGDTLRRTIATVGGGHATLIRATPAHRQNQAAFEPQPGPIAVLSARIKEKLDPAGIFSPGRMALATSPIGKV